MPVRLVLLSCIDISCTASYVLMFFSFNTTFIGFVCSKCSKVLRLYYLNPIHSHLEVAVKICTLRFK